MSKLERPQNPHMEAGYTFMQKIHTQKMYMQGMSFQVCLSGEIWKTAFNCEVKIGLLQH